MRHDNHGRKERRTARRRGFTLAELLAVVAILAIVAGIAFNRMQKTADFARRVAAESDMRAIASAFSDPETGYLRDMTGIPGFSPVFLRMANLFMATNVFGATAQGTSYGYGERIDDPLRRPAGAAPAEAFTAWDPEAGRGWRGPYLSAPTMEFPEPDGRASLGGPTWRERGFQPPLDGLRLPETFVSARDGCSIYGFPGEPALADPWGSPYVIQVPPPQAFNGGSTNVSDAARLAYARVVSAGPDGRLDTPCFGSNTNSLSTSWTPHTRRLARQAGLDAGGDRSRRGDDLVLFLFRADCDEGDGE